MEVESTLFDFNRISNNVGRFKGGLWEKYIAHEQANCAISGKMFAAETPGSVSRGE